MIRTPSPHTFKVERYKNTGKELSNGGQFFNKKTGKDLTELASKCLYGKGILFTLPEQEKEYVMSEEKVRSTSLKWKVMAEEAEHLSASDITKTGSAQERRMEKVSSNLAMTNDPEKVLIEIRGLKPEVEFFHRSIEQYIHSNLLIKKPPSLKEREGNRSDFSEPIKNFPSAKEIKKATESPKRHEVGMQFPDDPPQSQGLEVRVKQSPYSQLFKIGAAGFWVASISLVTWELTGIAAPFHLTFAVLAIPASIGTMAMAFLARRRSERTRHKEEMVSPAG